MTEVKIEVLGIDGHPLVPRVFAVVSHGMETCVTVGGVPLVIRHGDKPEDPVECASNLPDGDNFIMFTVEPKHRLSMPFKDSQILRVIHK